MNDCTKLWTLTKKEKKREKEADSVIKITIIVCDIYQLYITQTNRCDNV